MLQGTFETLSLPEVLGLLSSARKSGALWLDAGPISGVLHLRDGQCHATETADQRGPVDGGAALLGRLVEVCFAVMCQETGSFRFAADDLAPWSCPEPVQLSDALVEVDRLLKQWREILRVIPSLECRPRLLDALEADELIVDRARWALLVAIDSRRTVRDLVQRSGRPVLDVCHALLELVEAGAIGVIDPAPPRTPEPASERAPEPQPAVPPRAPELAAPEPVEPLPPAGVEREPAPVEIPLTEAPFEAPVEPARDPEAEPAGGEPTDKGAFLRLFSGLRES